MSPPERPSRLSWSSASERRGGPFAGSHGGRWVGVLAIVILILITINTIVTPSKGLAGIAPGKQMPPFAAPLATGDLQGSVNVAAHPNEGPAKHAACTVRGPQILNICQLYEQGPVVLALFIEGSACDGVLGEMQTLVRAGGRFSGVRFAAVALKGERSSLRQLVRSRGLTFPVGIDSEGVLPGLYAMASCPQITFAYPGGVVQSKALLTTPSSALLRRRVGELVAESVARGWRPSQ
ncbi:MAG: hypothetical protein ABSH36_11325 [Solirubrobacteraceae bacterium]